MVALPFLVLLGLVWVAFSAWTVRGDLTEARSAANRLEQALRDQDATTAETELVALQEHSNRAADWTDGPTWSVLGWTPVLGGDAEAIRLMSGALAEVAGDGLSPLVGALSDLEAGRFDLEAGRVPLDEVERLGPDLNDSQNSFERAAALIGQVEASGRVGLIQDARTQLSAAVGEGLDRLGPVRRAVRLLPPMLGADSERRYLLVLQSNAEIRSTGGFAGSTFQLVARDGAIDLVQPVTGGEIGAVTSPGIELTAEEEQLFGGRPGSRFVDHNFLPDFPRAAELMRKQYESQFGTDLDGVIAADPVLLSYLLEDADPIEARGVTLTSDNVAQELLSGAYARYEDPAEQDAFFRDAGAAVFSALTEDVAPAAVIDGLRRGAAEGRVMVTSTREAEFSVLAEAGLVGALPEDRETIQVGVYLNDSTSTTGSKLSYYLDYDVATITQSCQSGRADLQGRMTLTSKVPPDASGLSTYVTAGSQPLGAQELTVVLLGPRGGQLTDVLVDGRPGSAAPGSLDGRPGSRVIFQVLPGQSRELTWSMRTGRVLGEEVRVDVTPSARPRDSSFTSDLGCRGSRAG